jgi:hypothetical protein
MAADPTPATGATALLVLGMHRSGTSALAGALARLGVALGPRLLEAAPDNPLGYWEHAGVVQAHERLLHALGSSWEDPRELPQGWLAHPAARAAADEIDSLLREDFADAPLWAVKDPRLCRFLPLWLPLLARRGVQAKVLAIVREPSQVARSLAARDGIRAAHAEALWLRAAAEIAQGSDGLPRALLDFEQLMADPDAAIAQAAAQLQVQFPRAGESLRAAVAEDQRHHRREVAAGTSPAAQLHARLAGASDPWSVLVDAEAAVAQAIGPAREWLDGLVPAIARARQQQAEILAQLAETDAALERSDALSHERMLQLATMDAQLSRTQAALDAADALSRQHLDELSRSEQQLARTQRALADAEAISLQRMEENATLDAALSEAQRQCAEQLAELATLAAQLQRTEAALSETQAQSLERLAQMQALDARLGEMDAALAHATSLVTERTAERDAALARRR